jgi:hypothetical protein
MNPMKPCRCTRIEFYITLVELPVSRSNGKTRVPSDEGLIPMKDCCSLLAGT